jgi:hypothetical protein
VSRPFHRNLGITAVAVLASSATLVCCVLPAVLVALGAGAVLLGLVTAVPQLIWLSEHKALVFSIAAVLLLGSGVMLWNARRLPCPTDPAAARACLTLRSVSHRLFVLAAAMLALGALFAFGLPLLQLQA